MTVLLGERSNIPCVPSDKYIRCWHYIAMDYPWSKSSSALRHEFWFRSFGVGPQW